MSYRSIGVCNALQWLRPRRRGNVTVLQGTLPLHYFETLRGTKGQYAVSTVLERWRMGWTEEWAETGERTRILMTHFHLSLRLVYHDGKFKLLANLSVTRLPTIKHQNFREVCTYTGKIHNRNKSHIWPHQKDPANCVLKLCTESKQGHVLILEVIARP